MIARRAVLAHAALLGLAGCARAGRAPGGELTVTPAPVPTDPPPTPAWRLAPGLSEAGVVSPLALAGAHVAVLRSTSYRVHVVERRTRPDGRLVYRRVVRGTVAGPTRYRLDVSRETARGPEPASSVYADGERLYERLVVGDGARYYVPREGLASSAPEEPLANPTQRRELYVAFAGSRPEYVGPEPYEGVTHHRIAATSAAEPGFLATMEFVDAVEAYSFEGLVSPRGLVRSYALGFLATDGDDRRHVARTARWTEVGEATASPPAWYDVARARIDG